MKPILRMLPIDLQAVLACGLGLLFVLPARGTEYLLDESVAPESAAELRVGIESLIDDALPRYTPFWRLQQGGPFWRDSQIGFRMRGYDFDREAQSQSVSQASTLGGELSFRSGQWRERLSVAASLYMSYGVDAPSDKDGTGLLGPGQSDLSVLGKAFVQLDFDQRFLRLYRQDFNIPYINRQDSRMIPNTHEAYTFASEGERVSYLAAHVTGIKRRNSEDFISMAEAAGVAGGNGGTTVAGVRYSPNENFNIGGMAAYTRNAFNTIYAETNWGRQINDDLGVQVSGQYSDQRSVGRDRLGEFSTNAWGVRTATSFRNAILTLSWTDTNEGAAIRSPFGGRPGYSSLMLFDFDRAGEKAFRTSLSYNFSRIGLPGVSISYSKVRSSDAIDTATSQSLGDASEEDWTIDFRPVHGPLAGFWIRLRAADADIDGSGGDHRDLRLIFNYTLSMF